MKLSIAELECHTQKKMLHHKGKEDRVERERNAVMRTVIPTQSCLKSRLPLVFPHLLERLRYRVLTAEDLTS